MVQEIVKFLKADTAFMNIRPLRYSLVLDLHPDSLPHVVDAKRKLRLRDAILCSYHPNEVYVPFCLFQQRKVVCVSQVLNSCNNELSFDLVVLLH